MSKKSRIESSRSVLNKNEPLRTRRAFVKSLAGAPILTSALLSAASTPAMQNPAPATAPALQQPPVPLTPSPSAEALTELVRIRYGKQLTKEQLEEIKRDIEGNLRASERLRATKLKNSDEPDFVFSA